MIHRSVFVLFGRSCLTLNSAHRSSCRFSFASSTGEDFHGMQVQTPVFCADFSRFNEVSARSLPSLLPQTLVLIIFHVSLIKMLGRFVLTRALNHGGRSALQQSCHEEYREGNYRRVTLASSLLLSNFFRTNTTDWGCLIFLSAGSEEGGLGWYRRDVSRVWSREQHGD